MKIDVKILLAILSLGMMTVSVAHADPPANQKPTAENLHDWVEYIRPSGEQESWKKIPWRNGFIEAVEEAKRLDRPVLLWAMNGNPCGET